MSFLTLIPELEDFFDDACDCLETCKKGCGVEDSCPCEPGEDGLEETISVGNNEASLLNGWEYNSQHQSF